MGATIVEPLLAVHKIPIEILIRILQHAARSCRSSASALTRVSHWVRAIALTEIYSALVMDGVGSSYNFRINVFVPWNARLVSRDPPLDLADIPRPPRKSRRDSCHIDRFYSDHVTDREEKRVGKRQRVVTTSTPWGNIGDGFPLEAKEKVHSVCFLMKHFPETGVSSQLARAAVDLTSFPNIRRLSINIKTLLELLVRSQSSSQTPTKERLTLLRELSLRVEVRELELRMSCLETLGVFLGQLTHLRLERQLESFRGEDLQRTLDHLPSLTHLAFDYEIQAASALLDTQAWPESLPPILSQAVVNFLDNSPEQLQHLLLVSYDTTTEGTYLDPALEDAILQTYGEDDRLLSLTLGGAEIWVIWERLAREDRNLWDEALDKRRVYRSRRDISARS